MCLRDVIKRTSQYKPIRIFVNCQTIFSGAKFYIPEQEWNQKIRPYYDCEVIGSREVNGTTMVMI